MRCASVYKINHANHMEIYNTYQTLEMKGVEFSFRRDLDFIYPVTVISSVSS